MDCDAFGAGDELAEFQNYARTPRISSTMHADILAQILNDPFPLSSAMNAQTAQGAALGFIYRVRLVKAIWDEYQMFPSPQECEVYMHHPVFIAAISEIDAPLALKNTLNTLDPTYFERFALKDRCRNFI